MQELNREANTIGSKSIDAEISRISIELKVLIEQIREQGTEPRVAIPRKIIAGQSDTGFNNKFFKSLFCRPVILIFCLHCNLPTLQRLSCAYILSSYLI